MAEPRIPIRGYTSVRVFPEPSLRPSDSLSRPRQLPLLFGPNPCQCIPAARTSWEPSAMTSTTTLMRRLTHEWRGFCPSLRLGSPLQAGVSAASKGTQRTRCWWFLPFPPTGPVHYGNVLHCFPRALCQDSLYHPQSHMHPPRGRCREEPTRREVLLTRRELLGRKEGFHGALTLGLVVLCPASAPLIGRLGQAPPKPTHAGVGMHRPLREVSR